MDQGNTTNAHPKIGTYSSESGFFVWHYRTDTPTMANYDQLVLRCVSDRLQKEWLVDQKSADPLS
jgi:hypothetical protein